MNTNLIAVSESTINEELVQTVNARDLHEFLESKQDFSTWIKARIKQFEFVEGSDYVVVSTAPQKNGALESTGYAQERIDYHLTIDMGKELAMVERNAKGKQARQYFIAIEKAYRKQEPQFKIPKTLSEALQLAADQAKLIEHQSEQIVVMTPKAEYYDQLLGSHEVFDGEQTAKMLRTSRNSLYKFLKQRGVITKSNLPMQLYIDKDFMRVKQTPYNDVFGNPKISLKIVFTQTGIHYIRTMFNEFMVNVNQIATV